MWMWAKLGLIVTLGVTIQYFIATNAETRRRMEEAAQPDPLVVAFNTQAVAIADRTDLAPAEKEARLDEMRRRGAYTVQAAHGRQPKRN